MININYETNYYDHIRAHLDVPIVIYGAGDVARKNYKELGRIDFFCDKRAREICNIDGIRCITQRELENLNDKLIILICVEEKKIFHEICQELSKLEIIADVFYLFDNPAFAFFKYDSERPKEDIKEKLRIRLIYREDGWIFGKFAGKLKEELEKLGQDVSIDKEPDEFADVNHYIYYGYLTKFVSQKNYVSTTMVTHVDMALKAELIKFQADHGTLGICMAEETMNKLTSWGIKRDKLCYVNPAQDGVIKPRKIVLGITNRCYGNQDLRKRDSLIFEACKELNPELFLIKIMGSGWAEIVCQLRKLGFEVMYYDEFDRETYLDLMPSLDYWIYYGFDEGAMGYLDAMAAGVKTIVTPQGYHLDTKIKPTYLCSTIGDFTNTLLSIQREKEEIIASVSDWTWENYAKKHLEIWQYLTNSRPLQEIYRHQSEYSDGIFSVLLEDNTVV